MSRRAAVVLLAIFAAELVAVVALAAVRDAGPAGQARRCPEDAMRVGAACVPADDFAVCGVMQRWALGIFRERAHRRPVELALAEEARDLACTWQRDFLGPMLEGRAPEGSLPRLFRPGEPRLAAAPSPVVLSPEVNPATGLGGADGRPMTKGAA